MPTSSAPASKTCMKPELPETLTPKALESQDSCDSGVRSVPMMVNSTPLKAVTAPAAWARRSFQYLGGFSLPFCTQRPRDRGVARKCRHDAYTHQFTCMRVLQEWLRRLPDVLVGACMHACMHVQIKASMYVQMYVRTCVYTYEHMYVLLYIGR